MCTVRVPRHALLVAGTATVVALAATCADPMTPNAGFAGTYALRVVGDRAMPVRYPLSDPRDTVDNVSIEVSVVLTFRTDGTFTLRDSTVAIRDGVAAPYVTHGTGTFTLNGSRITMRYADVSNARVVGTFSGGNTLTTVTPDTVGGLVAVYQK